ncbi:hypothetical protein FM106_02115 [Brachybacterium faecium]|nr:hypothetical protein FM106_02115 [Brachybacterium faecium]
MSKQLLVAISIKKISKQCTNKRSKVSSFRRTLFEKKATQKLWLL